MKLNFRLIEAKELSQEQQQKVFSQQEVLSICEYKTIRELVEDNLPSSQYYYQNEVIQISKLLSDQLGESISYSKIINLLNTISASKKVMLVIKKCLNKIKKELYNYLLGLTPVTTKTNKTSKRVNSTSQLKDDQIAQDNKVIDSETNNLSISEILNLLLDTSDKGLFYEFIFYLLKKNPSIEEPVSESIDDALEEGRISTLCVNDVKDLYTKTSLTPMLYKRKKQLISLFNYNISKQDIVSFLKGHSYNIKEEDIPDDYIKKLTIAIFKPFEKNKHINLDKYLSQEDYINKLKNIEDKDNMLVLKLLQFAINNSDKYLKVQDDESDDDSEGEDEEE